MKRSCLTSLFLVATVAFSACSDSRPAPGAKADPAVVAATALAADPNVDLPANKRLALAKAPGETVADKAIGEAQRAVEKNVEKDELWTLLGRAWVRKARESADPGFYLNADACADVVLSKNADDAMANDLRGLVLLNGHEFEKARVLAKKVAEKRPDDPLAWGNLSDALLELGLYDEATEATQRMVDLKPNLPSYSRASHLQWLRGDVRGAKQTVHAALDAGRAAKSDPEPGAWVLVQAAMIFWNEGDLEATETGCDKALERISDYAPAQVGKARVAMARGEFGRAADLLKRALDKSPLVETAWLLGDAREAAGDAKGAAEAFALAEKEGRRTDPRTLSLLWSTKGKNVDEALKLARHEYELRRDIHTEDALAWALYRAGRIDEAKASIARARRFGTPDARLVYHEGAIRIAAGEAVMGKKLVESALAQNKAFDRSSAVEARALVALR